MDFTFVAILSAVFAAIANILARVLLKTLKSKDMLGINFLIMAATLLVVSPFFYSFVYTIQNICLVLLISVIDTLGNYYYFKTFEKTESSVATPILSLAPGFTFLFGWILLGDVVSVQTYALATILIISIIVFSLDFKNLKTFKSQTLVPALASSFLFGISAIPSKILLNSGSINAPTLYMFRATLIGMFAILFFRNSFHEITKRQYWFIFIRGLFVITQWILLYWALSQGNAGVTITLGNITPIFVFILSTLFLHEKPTIKKSIACILILGISLII
jgi:uncharacterized membrane protein